MPPLRGVSAGVVRGQRCRIRQRDQQDRDHPASFGASAELPDANGAGVAGTLIMSQRRWVVIAVIALTLLTSLVVQHQQQQSNDGLQELDGLALVSDSAF